METNGIKWDASSRWSFCPNSAQYKDDHREDASHFIRICLFLKKILFQTTCSVMRFCSQYKTEEDLNSCLSRESELRYGACVQGENVTNENSSKEISCHNCTDCNDMTPMLVSPCWGPDSSEDCCISLDACYVNANGICSCLSFPYYYYSKMSNLLRIHL